MASCSPGSVSPPVLPDAISSAVGALPPHLRERVRELQPGSPGRKRLAAAEPSDTFVLYWMQTALRVRENPSLDVACHIAREAGLPLIVHATLPDR